MEPLTKAQRATLEKYLRHPLGVRGKEYLDSRGLLGVAEDLRLGEVPAGEKYAGRLIIPSFSARGTVCDMAFRRMDEDEENPKYLFLPGIPKRLLGLDDLAAGGSTIHIAEGHPDRMTLKACGLPALGVAGVNAWKQYHARLLAGYEQVFFWAQADDKGQSEGLGERIRSSFSRVSVIVVPETFDVNTYYQQVGKQGILALLDGDGEASAEPEGEAEDVEDDDPRWAGSGFAPPPF